MQMTSKSDYQPGFYYQKKKVQSMPQSNFWDPKIEQKHWKLAEKRNPTAYIRTSLQINKDFSSETRGMRKK